MLDAAFKEAEEAEEEEEEEEEEEDGGGGDDGEEEEQRCNLDGCLRLRQLSRKISPSLLPALLPTLYGADWIISISKSCSWNAALSSLFSLLLLLLLLLSPLLLSPPLLLLRISIRQNGQPIPGRRRRRKERGYKFTVRSSSSDKVQRFCCHSMDGARPERVAGHAWLHLRPYVSACARVCMSIYIWFSCV